MGFVHSRFRILVLALVITMASVAHARYNSDRYDRDSGDREGYMFAATRSLNRTDAPVILKATLLPLTLIADIVFLPIAALADAVS